MIIVFAALAALSIVGAIVLARRRKKPDIGSETADLRIAEPSADARFMDRVVQLIDTHCDDSAFGVRELAERMHISRKHLHKKLTRISGRRPNNMIREARLERARVMLQGSEVSVTEVAFRVGFNSSSYFSKCFREQYGESPTEYLSNNVKAN